MLTEALRDGWPPPGSCLRDAPARTDSVNPVEGSVGPQPEVSGSILGLFVSL